MAKFTTFGNDVLDALADGSATGTLALGPASARVNYTLPIKVGLTTTLCTIAGIGTEFTGGTGPYARQSLSGSMAAAATLSKASNAALTFSGMPAGTWADVFTADSTGTPKIMEFKGTPSLAKTVNAGDTCLIPSGSLTFTET
jgi:hypothetical protein